MRGTLESAATRGSERVRTGNRISLSNSSNSKSLARPRAVRPRARTQLDLISWVSKIGPKSIKKSIKILMSFWSRFWRLLGPFGLPTWGRFRPFWRSSTAKFGPKPVLKACQLQKRDFSPNTRPRIRERKFQSQDGLQNAPRSAQDGLKTVS